MSRRDDYPPGVPCWVETLQPDPTAARDFYSAVLGWSFAGDDDYAVARLEGDDVAGVLALPSGVGAATWLTHVRVADVDASAARALKLGATTVVAPLDAAPAGRIAAFTDPQGALFALWQAADREGAQRVNENGAWAMSALQSPDPEASAEFYGALFGWEAEGFGPMSLFRLPGYEGGVPDQPVPLDVVAAVMPGDAAGWGVNFWTADCEAAAAAARDHGGSVLQAPHDQPPAFINAVLADAAGAVFSVSQKVGG